MGYSNWTKEIVSTEKILLDPLNPRILLKGIPTQDDLRNFLIKYYDVPDLARNINDIGGLPPTETLLCIKEGNDYIVVEGNRRLSACQILLNNDLFPNDTKKGINVSQNTLEKIKNLEVCISPSRDAAEPYITLRHSEYGTKKWSTLAQIQRIVLRFLNGETTKHISNVLSLNESDVKKSIKFHYFWEYVKTDLAWTNGELEIITNPFIKLTKIDRFLPFSKKAHEILTIGFDENYFLTFKLEKNIFNKALKIILTKILLENNTYNTRTPMNTVFDDEIIDICKTNQKSEHEQIKIKIEPDPSMNTEKSAGKPPIKIKGTSPNNKNEAELKQLHVPIKKTTQTKKPTDRHYFYEGIIFETKSQTYKKIQRALFELQKLKFDTDYRLATVGLLRCLLESLLHFYIVDVKKVTTKDLSLNKLLDLYENQNVFKNNLGLKNIVKNIDCNYLDLVLHAKYVDPDPNTNKCIENNTYSLVKFITDELKNSSGQTI